LFGSIPFGFLVCRLYGVDIRTVGSGRTGGTNAWRAAGLKAAIPTILGDAFKGAIAVLLVQWLYRTVFPEPAAMSVAEASLRLEALDWASALAGAAAVVGHNWSIFMGFKGGAGGITSAATTIALNPLVGSMVWIIGAFMIWWSRMASVGTFSVGVSAFAIFVIMAANQQLSWAYAVYGVIALACVLIALRRNRQQLKEQKERIITIW
jgi:glycerol-3-phosphate acyltransferase PlsY